MSYRNKTYICMDYDSDCDKYNIIRTWKSNDNIDFNFHNAHDGDKDIDYKTRFIDVGQKESYIKRILER